MNSIPEKKMEIIVSTWKYLLETGLSEASVGDLCKATKLSQSSLYYWFENKDDIWISAGKYGISMVVDKLFDYTFKHMDSIKLYFETLLDEVEKYKYDLRLAIQITTSPAFGDRMREKSMDFNKLYEVYGEKIIEKFGCTLHQVEVFIYTIIACVIDYAIWNDRRNTQLLLDSLYNRILREFDMEKQ